MISLEIIIIILLAHYIADFRWQTHWQASNKSKNNKALLGHVATYSLGLLIAGCFIFDPLDSSSFLIWVIYNLIAHFLLDYVSSRESSRRWAEQKWHDFFETIGGDQFLHYVFLFTSYVALA